MSNVPLRYTDRAVRQVPWWKVDYRRVVHPDPNPFPRLGWLWLVVPGNVRQWWQRRRR